MKLCMYIIMLAMCLGPTLIQTASLPSTHVTAAPASTQAAWQEIVHAALSLNLPVTDNDLSAEANDCCIKSFEAVRACNYAQGLAFILDGLHKFPHNFRLQANFATVLGDYAETDKTTLCASLRDLMVTQAKRVFDKLMQEAEGKSEKKFKDIIYSFKNEYYYRFRMHREQYENGVHRIQDYWGTTEWQSTGGWRGFYNQGVGAARYAQQLIKAGNKPLALDYAQKALVAWAQYFSYVNDYYNAYVHYALALGILGYQDEMMKALQRSASIIKRDLDYVEFKEVIDFVHDIQDK